MDQIPVMIVDDSEVDRYVATRLLEKHASFRKPREAKDGRTFLQSLYANGETEIFETPPTLVLMDINMPVLDGFEVIDQMKSHMEQGDGPDEVVVMMYSSSDGEGDKLRAAERDIVKGYVVKPLSPEDIAEIENTYRREVSVA